VKIQDYDRVAMMIVQCFLLGGVAFGEFGIRVLPLQWIVLELKGFDHCSEIFCFFFFFLL
jgi:hypothetical protein